MDTTSVSENTPPSNYWDNIKSLSLALETTFVECMLSSNTSWEEDRLDWVANIFSMTSTDGISPRPQRLKAAVQTPKCSNKHTVPETPVTTAPRLLHVLRHMASVCFLFTLLQNKVLALPPTSGEKCSEPDYGSIGSMYSASIIT